MSMSIWEIKGITRKAELEVTEQFLKGACLNILECLSSEYNADDLEKLWNVYTSMIIHRGLNDIELSAIDKKEKEEKEMAD